MKTFEIGKSYGAWDTGTPHITIVARTAKTITVEDNDTGEVWKMRTKENGCFEEATDGRAPRSWREAYTYSTKFEEGARQ